MSLEAAIATQTAALEQNSKLLAQLIEIQSGQVTTSANDGAPKKAPKKSAKKDAKPAPAEPEPAAEETPDDAPDLKDVIEALTTLAEAKGGGDEGRAAGLAVLARFDAKTVRDLDPKEFADVIQTAREGHSDD